MNGEWKDLAFTIRYDKDELNRWMRQTPVHQKQRSIMLLLIGLLTVNFLISIPTSEQKAFPVMMTLFCAALFAFVMIVNRRQKSDTSVDELYRDGAQVLIFVRGDRLEKQVEQTEETIPFEEITSVREHDVYFDIRYGKNGLLLLPKENMRDEQSRELSHHFEETLGKRYRVSAR